MTAQPSCQKAHTTFTHIPNNNSQFKISKLLFWQKRKVLPKKTFGEKF